MKFLSLVPSRTLICFLPLKLFVVPVLSLALILLYTFVGFYCFFLQYYVVIKSMTYPTCPSLVGSSTSQSNHPDQHGDSCAISVRVRTLDLHDIPILSAVFECSSDRGTEFTYRGEQYEIYFLNLFS